MKKISTMRIAAVALVLVLVTSCFVGGTFAKYISSATGTDNARVAYWGFGKDEAVIEINNLFDYEDDGVYNDGDVKGLIAPGTENSATFDFLWVGAADTAADATNGITGIASAPEVDYQIKVDTTGSDCADEIKNNASIRFHLDDQDNLTWDELLNAIKNLSGTTDDSGVAEYEAGTLPANFNGTETHEVGWSWAINDIDDVNDAQNVDDTALGNMTEAQAIVLKITVTATQLDAGATNPVTP